jgi:hypothetical protein
MEILMLAVANGGSGKTHFSEHLIKIKGLTQL